MDGKPDEKPTLAHETIIDLLKQHLKEQDSTFQILHQKSQNNVNISTSILVLVGFSKTISPGSGPNGWIVLIFLCWLLIFVVSLVVSRPSDWMGPPLDLQWDTLYDVSIKNDSELMQWLIVSYQEIGTNNKLQLEKKAKLLHIHFWALFVQVIFAGVYLWSL